MNNKDRATVLKKAESSLCHALLALETEEECRRFLADLCTPKEVKDMTDRWLIACALGAADDLSYRELSRATGVSTTTIGRVARFLNQEPHQGYRLILDRLLAREKNKPQQEGL